MSTLTVAGVLSGTSADGITCAIAQISSKKANAPFGPGDIQIRQLYCHTTPWSEENRKTIFRLFRGTDLKISEVCEANFALGKAFAEAVLDTIARADLKPDDVDLIGSHGQTVWHHVDPSGRVTSTLQIGEPAVIAEMTNITTIADFRVADVAAGGQGAPLVSTLDSLVLTPPPEIGGWRALQNIGGIGNVTLLPPANDATCEPLAFDTGPGNVFLDYFIEKLSDGKLTYDENGEFARKGKVNTELLELMMSHPYFAKAPPKTTGRELFSTSLVDEWIVKKQALGCSDEDFMATLVELTAKSIVKSYKDFCPGKLAQVFLAGGGSKNGYLVERIRENLKIYFQHDVELAMHEAIGFDSEAKEALLFALLAFLCAKGSFGNVPSCTFAKDYRVLGKIVPGKNYASISIQSKRFATTPVGEDSN